MLNGFYTVRAFYKKEGRIKYISHLDMNRCVSRELKRSGLPVWHTLGFNPHIYVTFALPLSLGYESICESFDFRLTTEIDLETARKQLNAVLPDGLFVERLVLPIQKPESIAWADYELLLEYDSGAAEAYASLRGFLEKPKLIVSKKSKTGIKEVDVATHFEVKQLERQENILRLVLRCAAGGSFNLNPTLLLETFDKECGMAPDWSRVLRIAILDEAGMPWA